MKSGRQKREEIDARRAGRREAAEREAAQAGRLELIEARRARLKRGELEVRRDFLAPSGSRDEPVFVRRGTYAPVPFVCKDCGKAEVWTPYQQKWWYEVAKGDRFTTATRCRPCRAAERRRKSAARRASLEGLERKPRDAKGSA